MTDADTGAKPLYAVWLTEKEAMQILRIAEEQDILRSVWNKIKASAHTKRAEDRVRVFIRETEAVEKTRITVNNPTPANPTKSVLLDRARRLQER